MRLVFVAALFSLAAAPAFAAPRERPLAEGKLVSWSLERDQGPVTWRAGDIVVRVTPKSDGELVAPLVRIEAPGMAPAEMEGESVPVGFDHWIGIGRLARGSARPDVILESFSGGAHCCTSVQVARPVGGRFAIVSLGEWDGGPDEDFPRDVDGDGVADWVMRDNAFLYAFSSYAQSLAPPRILNLVGTEVTDVSARPGFAALFRQTMAAGEEPCLDDSDPPTQMGACPGYLAAAARLGRAELDAAWTRFRAAWSGPAQDRGCRVEADPCPAGEQVRDYPEALAAFLVERGYAPAGWSGK